MPYAMLRTCESCGASNRVPAKHLANTGRGAGRLSRGAAAVPAARC